MKAEGIEKTDGFDGWLRVCDVMHGGKHTREKARTLTRVHAHAHACARTHKHTHLADLVGRGVGRAIDCGGTANTEENENR